MTATPTALVAGDLPEPLPVTPDTVDDWRSEGLCTQSDPDLFFPERGGSSREAKRICNDCPVRSMCLDWALNNGERFGVWGGTSERDRRHVRIDHAA